MFLSSVTYEQGISQEKNRVLALPKGSYQFKLPSKKLMVTKRGVE
jgi:hypothetical protein